MFSGFVFYMFLFLPISFKPEAQSWQPVSQFRLWMCFLWPTGCFSNFWISCRHLKIRRFHSPLPHQKEKKNPDFLLFLKNWRIWRHWVPRPHCSDVQELSNSCPLWTGCVLILWPHPHLACYLPFLYLPGPSQDSTENEASKIALSLVLNHLPWAASCSTSRHVPRTWRFWCHDWLPVCGFYSSLWFDTWHHSLRLPVLPVHPAPGPLHQEDPPMFHAAGSHKNQARGIPLGWLSPRICPCSDSPLTTSFRANLVADHPTLSSVSILEIIPWTWP